MLTACGLAHAQTVAPPRDLWSSARADKESDVRRLIQQMTDSPELSTDVTAQQLKASMAALEKSFEKREEDRAKKLAEIDKDLAEQLAKRDDPKALSEALKLAVERSMVVRKSGEKMPLDAALIDLVDRAKVAAHDAEQKNDWFLANELFVRLHLLLEQEGTYKPDVRRLGERLAMIRLHVPERFWKLRNDERIAEGKAALPPYNGLGEDYRERLAGIEQATVLRAVLAAGGQQIDRVPLRDVMLAGIESVRTMVTTVDLQDTFAGVKDENARAKMIAELDRMKAELPEEAKPSRTDMVDLVDEISAANASSVNILNEALLHEFGNGCMSRMDEFSAIIWPDELERFRRMTEGEFKGVGIHIQLDDETQMIKVVTPLEGTPAQRAGIKSGDLIKKINGQTAVGLSLNQAVDLITGPQDSDVTLTMERKSKDDEGNETTEDIEFPLKRAVIPLATVKGWKRNGPGENDWDWYIDTQDRIGYVRLLQFTDETTKELHKAIWAMKENGLNGMILDLRFNPGGLLTQAVSVANTFVEDGVIVSTKGTVPGEVHNAERGNTLLRNIPVVVLINEGSASASEIVSGAIRHYADKGVIDAMLIGERSFGKGSVQNVWPLSANTFMKLTTQYYYLPDGRTIHRKPGESIWGVDPHLTVQMLPEQVSEAIKIRQDADVLAPEGQAGQAAAGGAEAAPDPQKLLTDSIDLQLQTALVLLQARAAARAEHTRLNQ
jgi:carboxyl-terminal processing protease